MKKTGLITCYMYSVFPVEKAFNSSSTWRFWSKSNVAFSLKSDIVRTTNDAQGATEDATSWYLGKKTSFV